MREAALNCKIAATAEPGAENQKIPEIIFAPAYDGGVCNLDKAVWPVPVVFSCEGMEPLQVLPIVRDHDQDQKVGQTYEVNYKPEGITARGRMLNLGIDEAAGKVLRLWKRGSELQASIHTDIIDEDQIQFVPEGEEIAVNGRVFAGPVEVVWKTRLREISIVTVGANAGTSVEIQASAPAIITGGNPNITEEGRMSKLLQKGLSGLKERLNRIAKASDGGSDDAEAGDEGFIQWLADNAIDPEELTDKNLGALKAMYAKAAEGDEEEAQAEDGDEDAQAEDGGGDDDAQTEDGDEDAAAEDGEEKEGEAKNRGGNFRRKSPRMRKGAAGMKRTYAGPGAGAPNAARVAEASLLISCGMKPEKLDRKYLGEYGFGEDELNEAARRENRSITPTETLVRAGMCSVTNFKDFGHVSSVMNQAKFQAQAQGIKPGEYVTGTGRFAQAAGNLASVDIPTILANVMYKSLLVGFKDVPDPTDDMSKVTNAQDFRPQYFWTLESNGLDSNGNFEEVKENGELNVLKLSDTPYQNQVKLRGAECRYSYQMLIDDDQNALADIPQHMGRRFKIQKQQYWWGILAAAITGSNYTTITSNPTLSVGALDTAFGQMASIYDDNGEPIIANPKFVVGPTALGGTIRQIHTALDIVAAGGNALSVLPNANVYANAFTPIVSPFVGGSSKYSSQWGSAGWAVLPDPADLPVVIMSYLKGNNAPTMETRNGDFAVEGVRIGTWWGFGASLADKRGFLFSTGAGS